MKLKTFMGVLILVMVAVVLLIVARISGGISVDPSNYASLNTGWDIEFSDGTAFTDADIEDVAFPAANRGDTIVMTTVLPETDVPNPELEVVAIHSAIEVFLDGEMAYSYGMDRYDGYKVMGYGYHRFALPEDYAGKVLTIKMLVAENKAFTSFTTPRICNEEVCVRDYLYENRIPLTVNIFLIMFGVTIGVITGICMIFQRGLIKLFSTALFALFIGLWSLSNYNLLVIFTDNFQAKPWLEFGSLYVAPIFMLLYFWDESTHGATKLRKICYAFLFAAQTAYAALSIGGQALGLWHMQAVLTIDHLLLVLVVVYVLVVCVTDIVRGKTENVTLFVGAIIMVIFVSWDLLHYYIEKYFHFMTNGNYYRGITCIGTMLFVIAMIVSFLYEIVDAMYRTAEEDTLEKMAYTDAMTGLANRRRCEDMFDELDEGEADYDMIEFDLNNLKKVNDTLGHEMGDEFIKTFSQILANIFDQFGLVARTGGDEFLVIIKDEEMLDIGSAIDSMEHEIELVNMAHPDWNMSTAYGVSSSAQDQVTRARHAYKKADERMYENKAAMKKGRDA
ncbi:MAG: GGDEF domain-containing protein [Clostridiales bacterium]|nr:GGDEF domain-containing protein [Clostridiales bacterium]